MRPYQHTVTIMYKALCNNPVVALLLCCTSCKVAPETSGSPPDKCLLGQCGVHQTQNTLDHSPAFASEELNGGCSSQCSAPHHLCHGKCKFLVCPPAKSSTLCQQISAGHKSAIMHNMHVTQSRVKRLSTLQLSAANVITWHVC